MPQEPAARPPGLALRAALTAHPVRYLCSGWPWRCWAYLLSGALLGCTTLVVLAVLLALGVVLSVAGVGLVILALTALAGIPVGAVERWRMRLVDPETVPSPHGALPGGPGLGPVGRVRARLRERATWRELGHAGVLALVFSGIDLAFCALLGYSVLLLVSPLVVAALAPETVMVVPGHAVDGPVEALLGGVAGLLGLVLCGYLGALLASAQLRLSWLLLAARETELAGRVVELTRSRARLADAFEAERRRIERDLHDGAQQQLVALTMTLGLAELRLGPDQEQAAELLARARGEARRALDQLRDLVRGIHPQVLTDHGLAAAVTEVAVRNPIPVRVDLDLPYRLPGQVETMAYFSVTEALANASRHSGAALVTVAGRHADGLLSLLVTDDGCGGADPRSGTGLQGLADRLAILQGRLLLTSPAGGPTRLHIEVPCSAREAPCSG
ncbi:sensor histidine kinase [Kitasatospora sp. NPDC056138]|uniref:sensor histidine kinase n=1 Tax=Kitasatospora sp. NPDC056138 TaxID=3345724 RepID=UPI0035D70892